MRTALITGGAQGLGAAIARKFLGEGFSGVLLVDRNAEKLAAHKKRSARLPKYSQATSVIMQPRHAPWPVPSRVLAGLTCW